MNKRAWRELDGVLILDKSLGHSSHQALQHARRLLAAKKAGHTGALDPMATGVLPLCFGEATKFSNYGLEADKRYEARVHLGYVTPTLDTESEPILASPRVISEAELLNVLTQFHGEIEQVPPMFSALKFQGKSLYEYAREGVEIERKVRRVHIYALNLLAFDGEFVTLDVHCSKGTYIRTLAADLGEVLGCGAYLAGLRRTETAGFSLQDALDLEALLSLDEQGRIARLLPVDALVSHLPKIEMPSLLAKKIALGQAVHSENFAEFSKNSDTHCVKNAIIGDFRAYTLGVFLGVCTHRADGFCYPKRLLRH